MPNYGNGKIYSIRSHQCEDIYIGSTTQSLAKRLGDHRSGFKRYQNGKGHYVTSYDILKYNDHYIELICNYPCTCKGELLGEEELIKNIDKIIKKS